MRFSERYGYKRVREVIQIDSMDDALRNKIWSLLDIFYWKTVKKSSPYGSYLKDLDNSPIQILCTSIWFRFFKKPIDEIDPYFEKVLIKLRKTYFEFKWNEVYDFIEFIATHYTNEDANDKFMKAINNVLEQEMSGYRFIDKNIIRITDTEEIEAIEKAIDTSELLVAKHLRRALELLSDRTNPDHRNSIKESISAVESFVSKVTGEKGTLGQLIKKIDDRFNIHPALKSAFEKLYGYTSDTGGIRHALMEQSKIDFEDAKFMLVTCSAFINYVEGKLRT